MSTHDENMEQQKKGNQDPNRTQSSGTGGSTSQQSGKPTQGSQGSQSGSQKGSGSDRR